ncbi:MAG TPA: class I SAM-dependent methyltransferase [Candidatus Limnocylindrales bacterium]|nr:class I SAM-dependent methyltransferase [Candidatus Limnocylindrales bacterium]
MTASRSRSEEPVETRARALARLYDLDLVEDPGDLDLYLALAARTGGPILEIAAGTGRLAVPLAAAGHEVSAVDLDPAMLERAYARGRAAGRDAGARLELIEADLLDLELPTAGTFHLAFLALNSLFLLATRDSQSRAVTTLARHLAPGGIAVVDVWLPDASDLARFDGRLLLEYVRDEPESGREVTKMAAARHDPATATVDLTAIYEEAAPGDRPVRWIRRDALRLVGADELRAMASAAGLVVDELAGGYGLEPLGPGSERAILIARRP